MRYFGSSIFLRYLNKLMQGYLIIDKKLSFAYLSSFTHHLIGMVIGAVKTAFKFSIFGRLTEIHKNTPDDFFRTSKVVKVLLDGISSLKNNVFKFLARSSFIMSIKELICGFRLRPLKIGGIIVITAIMVNLIISIILQKDIGLCGWLIRVLVMFLGIIGLFSEVDWLTLKRGSILLTVVKKELKRCAGFAER